MALRYLAHTRGVRTERYENVTDAVLQVPGMVQMACENQNDRTFCDHSTAGVWAPPVNQG
ncbi:hypothetical protein GCM10025779_31200 [Arthrobacter cryoconiti]